MDDNGTINGVKRVADLIKHETRKWFEHEAGYADFKDAKAVVGISGGKDSSVVAALLANVLGPENVYGVMMPKHVQLDIGDSSSLCSFLGIKSYVVNIGSMIDDTLEKVVAVLPGVHVENKQVKTNLPARIRMSVLYTFAQSINGRVIGTGNFSESLMGYTTLWGDSVCDFNPIKGLFVDEVIAVGDALGLPERFTRKPPNDGMSGKTDEENLGFTYDAVKHWWLDEFDRGRATTFDKDNPIYKRYKSQEFKRRLLQNIPGVEL